MQAINDIPEGVVYRQFGSGELFIKTGPNRHEKAILDITGTNWSGDGNPMRANPQELVTVIQDHRPEAE